MFSRTQGGTGNSSLIEYCSLDQRKHRLSCKGMEQGNPMAQVMMCLNLKLWLKSHLALLLHLLRYRRLLRRSSPHQLLLVHVFRDRLPRRAPTMTPELFHRAHLAIPTARHCKLEYWGNPTIRQPYVARVPADGQPWPPIWQSYASLAI
jgi:hypothetical protein